MGWQTLLMSSKIVGGELDITDCELFRRCKEINKLYKKYVDRQTLTRVECRLQRGESVVLQHVQ